MFAAFKYRAIDYLYESVARQKFSVDWMLVPVPHGLHHDKNYCHTGVFTDDKYRRPWIRGTVIPMNRLSVEDSVLDELKHTFCVNNMLEKRWDSFSVSLTDSKMVEVVPSSNPCSQLDMEEMHLLMQDDDKEEDHIQVAKMKDESQELSVSEEIVFVDHLAEYAKQVPSLKTLLGRLKPFSVKDPLINFTAEAFREEDMFRFMTFQCQAGNPAEKEKDAHLILEDFCLLPVCNEEPFLLPDEFDFCTTKTSPLEKDMPSLLELKAILELSPESIPNGMKVEQIVKEQFVAKLSFDLEIADFCPNMKSIALSEYTISDVNPVCYTLSHRFEVEMPLTPPEPQLPNKQKMPCTCSELIEEPVSPVDNCLLITESTKESLEYVLWQSEKYQNTVSSLLLKEPQIVTSPVQQLAITKLQNLLSVHSEKNLLLPLESNWWRNSGLNLPLTEPIKELTLDLYDTTHFQPIRMEMFKVIPASEFEKWLEEKDFCNKQRPIPVCPLPNNKPLSYSEQLPAILNNKDCSSEKGHLSAAGINIHNSSELLNIKAMKASLQSTSEVHKSLIYQEKKTNNMATPMSCGVESDKPSSFKSHKSVTDKPERTHDDSTDLLSSFIMLRRKHIPIMSEEKVTQKNSKLEVETHAVTSVSALKEDMAPACVEVHEAKRELDCKPNRAIIELPASGSQYQAYRLLEAATSPVMNKLVTSGKSVPMDWKFSHVNFDSTRFFLKQHEKTVSDNCKQGKRDEQEITLFKDAALVHLLVTVRDILLMCSLDTALGYLSKVKDMYKSTLGTCLDDIWRRLGILQYIKKREGETDHKITALKQQVLNWLQKNSANGNQCKVLTITRMDSDCVKDVLMNNLNSIKGIKAMDLNPEEGHALLESQNVVASLLSYSCLIVCHQHIGAEFPWNLFSLVVEYDGTGNSCWRELCENLDIFYMTFKTSLPEGITEGPAYHDHFGYLTLDIQIPYMFIASEGLLNAPDILQLLESKYNMTFIERRCSDSFQLLGGTDRYVVITVDECTAIFMQDFEELDSDKSAEVMILKLMALSLQYSCCWIILYSKERLKDKYSLKGVTLHNLALMYAALIPSALKSEDLEVKVILTPGVEETALLIRQIADHTLLSSKGNPREWLDKTWLSLSPSEEEKFLLAFPCVNPLVAQVMLHKGSSLQWLLSVSFEELQEPMHGVPEKVLKSFTDTTSLHRMNSSSSAHSSKETPLAPANINCSSASSQQLSSSLHIKSVPMGDQYYQRAHLFEQIQKTTKPNLTYRQGNESHSPLQSVGREITSEFKPFYHRKNSPCEIRKNELCGHSLPSLNNIVTGSIPVTRFTNQDKLVSNAFSLDRNSVRNESTMPTLSFVQSDTEYIPSHSERQQQTQLHATKEPAEQEMSPPLFEVENNGYCNLWNQKDTFFFDVQFQPLKIPNRHEQTSCDLWFLPSDADSFLAKFQESPLEQDLGSFSDEFGTMQFISQTTEKREKMDQNIHLPVNQKTNIFDYVTSVASSGSYTDDCNNLNFQHVGGVQPERKRPDKSLAQVRESGFIEGARFSQVSQQVKRRRLSFEKVPGRCDGQTRLKFF